jgi:hypothetical protein
MMQQAKGYNALLFISSPKQPNTKLNAFPAPAGIPIQGFPAILNTACTS